MTSHWLWSAKTPSDVKRPLSQAVLPLGLFGDAIMEIDWSVGRILEALTNLNRISTTTPS